MSKVAEYSPLYGNVSQLERDWGYLIETCSKSWQLREILPFASR